MQPLVPYLLGESHPQGPKLTNVQRCVRTGDIEEVADHTHCTFFEMLGNWSLGDYFKEESIRWSWEFLTSEDWLGIDLDRLYFTVFKGMKMPLGMSHPINIGWTKLSVKNNSSSYQKPIFGVDQLGRAVLVVRIQKSLSKFGITCIGNTTRMKKALSHYWVRRTWIPGMDWKIVIIRWGSWSES